MNTISDDFEARLRRELDADAERAPGVWRDWAGPPASVVDLPRPRRRRAMLEIAVGAVAAAGVVAVTLHDHERRPEPASVQPLVVVAPPAVVVPPGTEFPLVDGGPATSTDMAAPAVGELTRALRIGLAGPGRRNRAPVPVRA